jgi:tetratricopeptide (TPR) repeat protein
MRKFIKGCAQVLPAFLIVVGTAVLLFAISQWWVAQSAQLHDERLVDILRTGKGEEYFNAKVELLNKRAEDVRNLLVYLLAIAGFVTAAQGLFAYFNVQNFTKQADAAVTDLEEIRKSAEEAESQGQERLRQIQLKAPVFAQMDCVIEDAVKKLALLFQDPDGLVDLYDKIGHIDRQRIMYYETSVAGLESVELARFKPALASIYRGLCVFYAAKYFSQRQAAKNAARPEPVSDDLHRARMYAELAREQNLNVFCIENDLGWVESKEGQLAVAEEHFNRSLALHPTQQRAGTNLGIVYIKQKKYGDAVLVLRRALAARYWEVTKETLRSRPCYNLACALTRVAEIDVAKRAELLDEACCLLEEAINYDTTGMQSSFQDDTAEAGDLGLLQNSAAHEQRMAALAIKYEH